MKIYILILTFLSLLFVGCNEGSSNGVVNTSSTGVSGSMARFSISGDYLYTINRGQMNIFDIHDSRNPQSASKVRLPFDIETLFAYENYLYIGASSGMYIYDKSIPTQPTKITDFIHAQSCDPVVVQNNLAYITLNNARDCSITGDINRLEIVDVSDPYTPILIKTVDMWAPKGLGVDDDKLFICDGDSGLKVFDINQTYDGNSTNVELTNIDFDSKIDCYDLIPFQNTLVISNNDEIRQYDYSSFPMFELGQIK